MFLPVSSRHVHLLVADDGDRDMIPNSMQLVDEPMDDLGPIQCHHANCQFVGTRQLNPFTQGSLCICRLRFDFL